MAADQIIITMRSTDYAEEQPKCVRGKLVNCCYKFIADGEKTKVVQISCADPCGMVPSAAYNHSLEGRNNFIISLKKVAEGAVSVE